MPLRLPRAAVAVPALVVTACASTPSSQRSTVPSAAASSPAATTPRSEPAPAPTPRTRTTATATAHAPSQAQVRALVSTTVAKIIKSQPDGAVSVAALNTVTAAHFAAGAQSGMWTASAYKLLALTALLLRDPDSIEEGEFSTAARALESSDNAAGYSLFLSAGGNSGVDSALDTLKMSHTVPGQSDPTFTTTSAPDFLRLLKALVATGPLPKSARSAVLGLMRNVEDDQRWGVGEVADPGTRFANKNGWLAIDDSNGPGETDGGRWAVASVGVLTVHRQQVLMAVFTQHQPDFATGVKLVTKLARAIVPAVSS